MLDTRYEDIIKQLLGSATGAKRSVTQPTTTPTYRRMAEPVTESIDHRYRGPVNPTPPTGEQRLGGGNDFASNTQQWLRTDPSSLQNIIGKWPSYEDIKNRVRYEEGETEPGQTPVGVYPEEYKPYISDPKALLPKTNPQPAPDTGKWYGGPYNPAPVAPGAGRRDLIGGLLGDYRNQPAPRMDMPTRPQTVQPSEDYDGMIRQALSGVLARLLALRGGV